MHLVSLGDGGPYPKILEPLREKESVGRHVQRGVNLFELFARHQPGVAGCGWLQPGGNFLST